MTKIKPFKAVRPPRDKAYLVASRPYYTYKKKILAAKLQSNKFTFLHVINPEFNKTDKTLPNSNERFQKVRERYDEFLKDGYFFKDQKDSFYIYRQQIDQFDYVGIVAGASVQEYLDGKIKIHEHTITEREETFKRYLDICNFNAEPVLLTYPDHQGINNLIDHYLTTRSEYEFTTTDDKTHNLWVVDKDKDIEKLKAYFEEIPHVYIADGHHRSASSVLFSQEQKANKHQSMDFFLAFFINESRLKIYDYNRVVTSLNDMSESEFLEKLNTDFIITPLSQAEKPNKTSQFTMNLGEKAYKIQPKEGKVDLQHPVKSLDAQILSDLILEPILGILDSKTDKRVLFVDGTKGIKGLKSLMKKENAKVAFSLFPVSVEELKNVSDNNMIMPPKSTWIEPKLRSGLTIYEYND